MYYIGKAATERRADVSTRVRGDSPRAGLACTASSQVPKDESPLFPRRALACLLLYTAMRCYASARLSLLLAVAALSYAAAVAPAEPLNALVLPRQPASGESDEVAQPGAGLQESCQQSAMRATAPRFERQTHRLCRPRLAPQSAELLALSR